MRNKNDGLGGTCLNLGDPLMTLYPVVLKVPGTKRQPRGRAQVRTLARLARRAARISAQTSRLALKDMRKNDNGVPLPEDGIHWSITHKPDYVGGVVAPFPVGIDIERIKPVREGLFGRIAAKEEWDRVGGQEMVLFFRFWTAKEAVLKAAGVGFAGLSRCRVQQVLDENRLVVTYEQKKILVHQVRFEDHIAAITGDNRPVQWVLV